MSIRDDEGNEIVRLNAVWEAAFKFLLIVAPFVGVMLFTWGTWVTIQIFDHSATLRLLEHKTEKTVATSEDNR